MTGERDALSPELAGFIRTLRTHTTNPIAVGFGISTPEQVQAVWSEADGAVVGSAIVHEIEKGIQEKCSQTEMAARVGDFVEWLRGARKQRRA